MSNNPKRILCFLFAFLTLSTFSFIQVHAALTWNLVDVDTTSQVSNPTIALDSSGYPHFTYYDEANSNLKYAKWTGTSWGIQNVESLGSGYDVSDLALDSNNVPHILYTKYTMGQLKYAVWSGSSWNIQVINQALTDSPRIACDKSGNFHIIFRSSGLKYAKLIGSSWDTTTVDPIGGYGNSLAVDNNGNPHISYVSYVSEQQQPLRYAKWTGSAWDLQTVDGTGICYLSSLALDSNGYPHISYSFKANQTSWDLSIKYAKWTGSGWIMQTVDSQTGYFSSVVLASNNSPQICYNDFDGNLKYASWTGSAWSTQTVDASSTSLGSMVLHSTGNPRIAYSDSTDLKYAELIDPEVTTPIPELTSIAIMATLAVATLLSAIAAHAISDKKRKKFTQQS